MTREQPRGRGTRRGSPAWHVRRLPFGPELNTERVASPPFDDDLTELDADQVN